MEEAIGVTSFPVCINPVTVSDYMRCSTVKTCMCSMLTVYTHVSDNPMRLNFTGQLDQNVSDIIVDEPHSSSVILSVKWEFFALIIAIVGTIFGNILVFIAVFLYPQLRNKNNFFLVSLAITDLLVAILVMPFGLLVEVKGYFPLDWSVCAFWCTMDVFLCTASIWHMAAISLDRLISLKYPLTYGRNKTAIATAAKIFLIWIITVPVGCSVLIMSQTDHRNVFNNGTCAITEENFMLYGSIVAFLMPLAIMVITYILTLRILHTNLSSATLARTKSEANPPERKASKVLGIVVMVFCCLWTPFFVANILQALPCDRCKAYLSKQVMSAFLWLGYISSMANPIIYTIFNRMFRNAFVNILCCHLCRSHELLQLSRQQQCTTFKTGHENDKVVCDDEQLRQDTTTAEWFVTDV